jgi:tetratricopeptide (TPR) repeat protein
MKLFFRIIFKIFLIFAILAGCTTTQEIKEDSETYYNRGLAYVVKGQFDKAIPDFNKAIDINPRYAEAYADRGVVYIIKGQYDKAIADYNKAIEINPKDVLAYNNRALAYKVKGQYHRDKPKVCRGLYRSGACLFYE